MGEEGFEGLERSLTEAFCEAQREVTAEALAGLDEDVPCLYIGGQRYRRAVRSKGRYLTAAGAVEVERTLYRSARSARSVAVLDVRAGVVAELWTPLAARQGAALVAHVTPQEAEGLLAELGHMRPSKSSLDRLPKVLGGAWEAEREGLEARLRAQTQVPEQAVSMAVSLDGVMVPMKEDQGAGQSAEGGAHAPGKKSVYREASCATLSFFDAEGKRLSSVRMARMPEAKKATLKAMLAAEVHEALGQRPELTVVKLADGAKDNWTYLDSVLPAGESVLDFYHAAEQLSEAFDAAYGQGSAKAGEYITKYRHILRHEPDGAKRVIRALRYQHQRHPRSERIAQVLQYFRNNRHRMRYHEMKARNLPIGSGVVEAACKTLVTQRLKRSGMRWRIPGGQAILTLRSWAQSGRFENGWEILAEAREQTVELPENVVPLRARRGR
ncbi:MAG: hypothetical protein D6701_02780 [Gemmatimonadetes bacterium]|nr:MAG: hypothetical protein D6701_02780 [Gemmatimonadota bacterium]